MAGNNNVCPQCGAPIEANATECKYCGEKIQAQVQPQQQFQQPQQQGYYPPQQPMNQMPQQQPYMQNVYVQQGNPDINPAWPIKSKVTAGLLAIFLGGLGIHKFYMGKIGLGILYLLFCWTYVPEIVSLIEGIIYLATDDYNFQVKNHVRIQ